MDAFGPLTYIFAFLLLLTPIVFIHEYGHYWVARRNGVIVDAFSIGFGPELFHWIDKNGTRWRIAALPLGGFVKMRGDENAASMTSEASRRIKGSFASAQASRQEWQLLPQDRQLISSRAFLFSHLFIWVLVN